MVVEAVEVTVHRVVAGDSGEIHMAAAIAVVADRVVAVASTVVVEADYLLIGTVP